MRYWQQQGYEDGLAKWQPKSEQFFQRFGIPSSYQHYMSGYRRGKEDRERNVST